MGAAFVTALQGLALLLISLVAGAMFGIWRGYDPATFGPGTFVEVHQGAVHGLNTLLPAIGLGAISSVAVLAFLARSRPAVLWFYIAAGASMVAAALITRFGNQPINAQIMSWTAADLPDTWTALRDSWWSWHLGRLTAGIAAELLLIAAVFSDRASQARSQVVGDVRLAKGTLR